MWSCWLMPEITTLRNSRQDQAATESSRRAKIGSGSWGTIGRRFAVQPILFLGQSSPGGFHALVSLVGGLVGGALGKLGAILRILQKMLRLFHGVLHLKMWGANAWIQW